MTTFRISFRADGQWQGTREGDEQPIVIALTKAQAMQEVFNQARELGHSRVLVFDGAGTETEERTFGAPRAKGYAGNWD